MSLRLHILRWALREFVGTVDPFLILTCDDKTGIVRLNGEQVSKDELRQLKTEARALQSFKLWQIMTETLKQKAIEKAVITSTDFEQVLSGKLMLHNIGIQKSIIQVVEKAKHI
jgi:hypothetical protein